MKKFKGVLYDVGIVLETIIILGFFLAIAVWFYVKYWPRSAPIDVDPNWEDKWRSEYGEVFTRDGFRVEWTPLNINTASELDLQTLKGIGEGRARAIIEYREANGDFTSVEQITEVDGITEKMLEVFRKEITV